MTHPSPPVLLPTSRFHLTDERPFSITTEEGEQSLGKGWLIISEREYGERVAVQNLSDDKCAICGKPKMQHNMNCGISMCQVYPSFVSERAMAERLARAAPSVVVER